MAGPLDIQRVPAALIDLLGMKGSGATPYALAEQIAVTLADGVDYYLAPRRIGGQFDTAVAITGSGFAVAVGATPAPSEAWLVYNCTATLDTPTAAATAIKFAGALRKVTGQDVQLTDMITVGASDNGGDARVFERPCILLPGDQLGFRVYQTTGAPGSRGRIVLDYARVSL